MTQNEFQMPVDYLPDYDGVLEVLRRYRDLWHYMEGGWSAREAENLSTVMLSVSPQARRLAVYQLSLTQVSVGYTSHEDWMRDPDKERHLRVLDETIKAVEKMRDADTDQEDTR